MSDPKDLKDHLRIWAPFAGNFGDALNVAANELETQATLITELVGALDDALDDLNTDIRWADDSQLEGLIERRTKLEAALTKAKDQTNDR